MADEIKVKLVLEGDDVVKVLQDTGKAIDDVGAKAESSSGAFSKAKGYIDAFTGGVSDGMRQAQAEVQALGETAERSASGFTTFGAAVVSINQGIELAQKVIRGIGEGFQFLGDTLERGNKINDLEAAFRTLGTTTGATAGDLKTFEDAMGGTITHAEALTTANKALQAGLDPKILDDAAKAARAYADSIGGDAKQSLDQLTEALVRGNDRALKNMGVIIDNKQAYEDFAKANGIAADTLNELGKAEAIRAAAAEALKEKVEQLGEVTNDSADNFQSFKNSLTNAFDKIAGGIAENEALNRAMGDLARVVKEIDLTQLTADLSSLFTMIVQGAQSAIPAALQYFHEFTVGVKALQQAVSLGTTDIDTIGEGILTQAGLDKQNEVNESLKNLKQTYSELANISLDNLNSSKNQLSTAQIDGMIAKLGEAKKAVVDLGATVPKDVWIDELEADLNRLKKTATDAGATVKKSADAYVDHEAAAKKAAEGAKKLADEQKKQAAEATKAAKEQEKLNKAYLDQQNKLVDIMAKSREYARIQEDLKNSTISQAEANERIASLYDEMEQAALDVAEAQERLNQAMLDAKNGVDGASARVAQYTQDLKDAEAAQQSLTESSKKGSKEAGEGWQDYASSISQMFGGSGSSGGYSSGGGSWASWAQTLAQSAQGYMEVDRNRDKYMEINGGGRKQEELDKMRAVGMPIANMWTFGLAEVLEGIVGRKTMEKITGVDWLAQSLFGENQQTLARKQFGKFMNDLLEDQNVRLKDAPFWKGFIDTGPSNQFNPVEGQPGWGDTLMADPSGATFVQFGEAMEEALGMTEDIGGQIGKILFDNVGGSLNNLQLLIQATGLSAEQMKDAVVEGFLDSEFSATEALGSINAINQVFEAGIPGAIGATTEAMDNLIASAGRGRAAVDALGDLGAEALETNAKTLEQLQADLVASGKYTPEQVKKLFDALAAAGIKSLEDLKNISAETAIGILANMENAGFGFDKFEESIEGVKKSLEEIKSKSVDVEVNVKTNIDDNTQTLVNGGLGQPVYGSDNPGNVQ